jgi:DNA polymerase III alpha subunit
MPCTARAPWSTSLKFINRKHGREKIEYDSPAMEKYLKDTYGITVYQEQVMLLSQELAGFTKGLMADSLSKAMGKKIEHLMADLQPKFFERLPDRTGYAVETSQENLVRLGIVCALCLQQVAFHLLCLCGIPDGLPESPFPG